MAGTTSNRGVYCDVIPSGVTRTVKKKKYLKNREADGERSATVAQRERGAVREDASTDNPVYESVCARVCACACARPPSTDWSAPPTNGRSGPPTAADAATVAVAVAVVAAAVNSHLTNRLVNHRLHTGAHPFTSRATVAFSRTVFSISFLLTYTRSGDEFIITVFFLLFCVSRCPRVPPNPVRHVASGPRACMRFREKSHRLA